jgi:ribosomal protein S18 acetylase RimI-like enzyme
LPPPARRASLRGGTGRRAGARSAAGRDPTSRILVVRADLVFDDLGGFPDAQRLIPEAVAWVCEAGSPYFPWLFGGEEVARAVLARWMARPTSEIAIGRARRARAGQLAVGGYIALDGVELAAARAADALALLAWLHDLPPAEREQAHQRLTVAHTLFPRPTRGAFYYLSKMGVAPGERRRGYGRAIVAAFLETGLARGFTTFRLDVAADNVRARRLYESAGFAVIEQAAIPGTAIAYCAMVHERGGA